MVDPAGTCHRTDCPGKGKHPPHDLKIGAGEWKDYKHGGQPYCIGFAQLRVETQTNVVTVSCSIAGEGTWGLLLTSGIYNPAVFTDRHKAECPNRKARPDGN